MVIRVLSRSRPFFTSICKYRLVLGEAADRHKGF
jgi:hypothetical protein